MGNVPALTFLTAALAASAADRDPARVLLDTQAKVAERAARLPRYTCVETIERQFYLPAAPAADACSVPLNQRPDPMVDVALARYAIDRFRLDVTQMGGNEIYSWAGANRFHGDEIERLVSRGPVGTGVFAGLLDVVFLLDRARFYFHEKPAAGSGDLIEYYFTVDRTHSHYRVNIQGSWVPVDYTGTVAVTARTSTVARLTINSGRLPQGAAMCQIQERAEYRSAEIAGKPFLLPATVIQRFLNRAGGQVVNSIGLMGCREYAAESEITFGAPAPSAGMGATTPADTGSLPPGLHLSLQLLTAIDTATAAAGDGFRARLVNSIVLRKQKISIPAGSIVEGRLLRVESFPRPPQHVRIVLGPRTVWLGSRKLTLRATRDWKAARFPNIILPLPEEGMAGVFDFPGYPTVIPEGFRSEWRTAAVTP